MANQIKKKFLAPEVIDYFDDQIDVVEQGLAQELIDRAEGDINTLASSKAYTDSKFALIPPVDLSNYYNKSEVDGKDLVLSNRISALELYDQETVFVDNVNGVDEVGRGSMLRPFKTINYAYSQVESLGAPANTSYNANVERYVSEKLVIHLAPGRYVGDVVLGFKRARVRLVGDGATIVGHVKMSVKLGDFPCSILENFKSNFPAPFTGVSAFMNFECAGKSGGGVENDATSNVLTITGIVSMAFEESAVPGSGLNSWDTRHGQFYSYLDNCSVGAFVVTTNYTTSPSNAIPAGVIEVEGCSIGSALGTYRTFFGIVPYAYLTDFAAWNTTSKGTTNKVPLAGSDGMILKAHNSTIASVIGPAISIGEIDGCRIYDIDRTMRGTVDNGRIAATTSTSYIGMVNNQFRQHSPSTGDLGSVYRIGVSTSGTVRYKMDSVSYTTFAFNRNSSGVLAARTLDVAAGTSVVYDLLDDARSIFVNDAATNYTRSANTVDSALEGIDAALGLKANQSSIAAIELNVSNLSSSVTSLQLTDTSLQSQINTEKGRVDAILLASEADKDSFSEIVSLINQVDTANDQAFAAYALANDARVTALEAKGYAKGSQVIGAELGFIDLDRQYAMLLSVTNGRVAAHEGEDFTVSVVGGVTRLTWINSFANPSGVEKIQAGDKIFWAGAF